MREFAFTAHMPIQGKGRPRLGRHGAFTPQRTKDFEKDVANLARQAMTGEPFTSPVSLNIIARVAMPKSWTRQKREEHNGRLHTQKPDFDNVEKAIADALNGIVYADDQQIAISSFEKRWGERDKFCVIVSEAA